MAGPLPAAGGRSERAGGGLDATAVLRDLPVDLWSELLRAFRRAADRLPRADLPTRLRPFVTWKPERLAVGRPRRVLAAALATDPWLREVVAEELAGAGEREAAARQPADRLVEEHGEARAAALLVVLARWEDLAAVAAQAAAQAAARHQAAAEARTRRASEEAENAHARLLAELEAARSQREELRRRAADAERRANAAGAERDQLTAEVERLRAEVARLDAALAEERARGARQLRKVRRQLADAEARARVDLGRVRHLLAELELLGAGLRQAIEPEDSHAASGVPRRHDGAAGREPARLPDDAPARPGAAPRTLAVAAPGRPCRLPPGLSGDQPDGVAALLQCPGIQVLLDGYNLTKHPRGRANATLEEQRRWLVAVAGSVAARFRNRVTVAFDGAEPRPGTAPSARNVQVVFSQPEETADDLIVELLASLPPDRPALVVTSDRELCGRVAAQGADCVAVEPFLEVVGV